MSERKGHVSVYCARSLGCQRLFTFITSSRVGRQTLTIDTNLRRHVTLSYVLLSPRCYYCCCCCCCCCCCLVTVYACDSNNKHRTRPAPTRVHSPSISVHSTLVQQIRLYKTLVKSKKSELKLGYTVVRFKA